MWWFVFFLNVGSLPAELSLRQAIDRFAEQGFDVLLAEAQVQGAVAQVDIAGMVTNPQVSGSYGKTFHYQGENQAFGVGLTDQAALSDIVNGTRHLRLKAARLALAAANLNRDDAWRLLVNSLKNQYLQVAVSLANLAFASEIKESYARTAKLFSLRYQAGDISETDLARLETAALGAEQEVDTAQEALLNAKVGLAYLLGERGVMPDYNIEATWLEQSGDSLEPPLGPARLLPAAQATRPDVLAAQHALAAAQASLQLAKRLRVPTWSLALNYQQEGSGQNALQPPTLTVNLALTLPVWYQYQGEIAQARANLTTQSVALRKIEATVASDVQVALDMLRIEEQKLQRMRVSLRVRAARALQLVKLQYTKGAASLLDLLDAQRTYIATNQNYLATLSNRWSARFLLEQALSVELAP